MAETPNATPPLSPRIIAAYGAGDFGLNFYWQGAGFFLLFFYTDVLGLPNTTAGAVFATGGLVDAVTDPAMGFFAERRRGGADRYRPYLLFGALPLGLSFIVLFAAPLVSPLPLIAFVAAASHILFRLAYTFVSIPYSSLGARLTFDAHERTRLAGVRMLFGAAGGALIVFTATGLRAALPDGAAFVAMSMAAAAIGAGFILLAYIGTTEKRAVNRGPVSRPPYAVGGPIRHSALLANGPFLILMGAILLLTIANMIIVKMVLYRFTYILESPMAGGLAMSLMSAAPLVTIPIWIWTYLKLDKRPAFLLGCAIVIIGLIALAWVGNREAGASIIAHALIAAGFSSFAVGFWSILPDVIDYGQWKTGRRIESGLVGLASAGQKIAIALAGLGVGLALDASGYQAGAAQTARTLRDLHVFGAIVPLILMLAAAAIFSRYSICATRHREIIRSLEAGS